jgi:hypothetical protein
VFRFEWLKYKRVLRASSAYRYRAVKVPNKAFYEQLYCLTPPTVKWDTLAGKSKAANDNDDDGRTKNEWLRATLSTNACYSVPTTRVEMNGDGVAEEVTEPTYFQVLSKLSKQSRPKLVPTAVEDSVDLALGSSFAVNVQYMDVWSSRSPTEVTTYFDSDPMYMNVGDLAPWGALQDMTEWQYNVSDTYGCIDLTSPVRAAPRMALNDASCPLLTIYNQLRADMWVPVALKLEHTDTTLRFDSRNKKAKRYFQVLLSLGDRLRVNHSVFSGQPISYYDLVFSYASPS